jgi:tetratricopeptide (TPR) repeat protein
VWLGEFERAIADLTEAIRLDPSLAGAHMNRGNAYAANNDPGRALRDLCQAIRLDPNDAAVYESRARVYSALNDWANALRDEERARKRRP